MKHYAAVWCWNRWGFVWGQRWRSNKESAAERWRLSDAEGRSNMWRFVDCIVVMLFSRTEFEHSCVLCSCVQNTWCLQDFIPALICAALGCFRHIFALNAFTLLILDYIFLATQRKTLVLLLNVLFTSARLCPSWRSGACQKFIICWVLGWTWKIHSVIWWIHISFTNSVQLSPLNSGNVWQETWNFYMVMVIKCEVASNTTSKICNIAVTTGGLKWHCSVNCQLM